MEQNKMNMTISVYKTDNMSMLILNIVVQVCTAAPAVVATSVSNKAIFKHLHYIHVSDNILIAVAT